MLRLYRKLYGIRNRDVIRGRFLGATIVVGIAAAGAGAVIPAAHWRIRHDANSPPRKECNAMTLPPDDRWQRRGHDAEPEDQCPASLGHADGDGELRPHHEGRHQPADVER